MKKLLALIPLVCLAGCNTPGGLTPAQDAALFCVISSTGVVLYQGFATGAGAAKQAAAIGAAQIGTCNAAGAVATIIGTPASVTAATAGVTPVAAATAK